jgi:hypothetical protein
MVSEAIKWVERWRAVRERRTTVAEEDSFHDV